MKTSTQSRSFLVHLLKRKQISEEDLVRFLDTALSRGGEFAEIFLEYRVFHSVRMEDDIIKETAEVISQGLGVRVIHQDQTGYGYTNRLSPRAIEAAALTAAAVASGKLRLSASGSFSQPEIPQFYSSPDFDIDLEKKIGIVRQAYKAAFGTDSRIKKVNVALVDQIQHSGIWNSLGSQAFDRKPILKLICMAIAEQNKVKEGGYSGGGGRVGLDYFISRSPAEIGKEAAEEAATLLEARPAPAGEMPVILAPGDSGVLIHEAVGHLLEADFIRKKTSVFHDKFGQKVGSEQVNIFDDPTLPGFRGSYNLDDEGTVPQKTVLIRNGIIEGFLQDRLSAGQMKMPLTGHGRREDYSCIPIPRMSNTYIDKGEYDPDEIIRSVSKGIYARRFQGGQVEDSGRFTFSLSSGYRIENGVLTAPVKQATLIGSNLDILGKVERVGHDLEFGLQTGTCGKEGQSVPVTDGCPTIKIGRMTVGGHS
ncbi:MAG: TldD/PmbA family protein [Candidatus Aminicenantes bacterium]